jgi:hypothetical protein
MGARLRRASKAMFVAFLLVGAILGTAVLAYATTSPTGFSAYPGTTTTTTQPKPAQPIQFGKIQYDSPGADTGSRSSLNAEWVAIHNSGTTTKNLKGFTVRDAQNHVYKFSSNFSLKPNKTVKIHTGKGTNNSTDRYWGRTSYVWNNGGDKATLKNANGTTLDICAWSSRGAGYKQCPTT